MENPVSSLPVGFMPEADLTAAEVYAGGAVSRSAYDKAVDTLSAFDEPDRARFAGAVKVAINAAGAWCYFRLPDGSAILPSEQDAKNIRRALVAACDFMAHNATEGGIPRLTISLVGRVVRIKTATVRPVRAPLSSTASILRALRAKVAVA